MKMDNIIFIVLAGVLVFTPTFAFASAALPQLSGVEEPMPSGTAQALVGNASYPEFIKIQFLAQLPKVSPEEQKSREENLKKIHLPGPRLSQGVRAQIFSPAISRQTNVTNIQSDPNVIILQNSSLGAAAQGKSTMNEPSIGSSGDYIFYTGNWYAARSTDGGSTFSFINPYADMPSFCCDQDVLYEQSRDIFIWYRPGLLNRKTGANFFRLGISNDTGATWFFYDIYPTNVSSTWTNQWWDYPRLALSNNYLYIASNMFDSSISWTRTVLLRFPLDALKNHNKFNYDYYSSTTDFNFAPVQGATSTIYWGTHKTTSLFRLFSWDESSNTINFYDNIIPAWIDTGMPYSCPGPDGKNWCERSDNRVLSGWVAHGTIGFFWNVMQGGGFSYPYVNAATFNENTKSYIGRPYIWNPNYAFMYGDVAPDDNGHLGISIFWGGGSFYPNHAVGIADSISGAPPPWEIVATMYGTNGPNDPASLDPNGWGDYIRARPYNSSLRWAATGYTLQGGTSGRFVDPRYFVFGRIEGITVQTFNISGFKINGSSGKGIADWNITLNNALLTVTTSTNGTGFYNFSGLVNGTYSLTEDIKPGFMNITPISIEVVISGTNVSNVNFTNIPVTQTFNISGYKINGSDGSMIAGWNITLKNSTMQESMLTDASGAYRFENLENGSYNVTEEMKPGFTNVSAASATVTVTGHDIMNLNFTNMPVTPPPSISIEPPSTTANQSDTFSVNVTVDPSGNQVKGVEINLKFNQTVVQLNSVVIGNFLGNSPQQFQNKIDNTNGTLTLAHTVQGGGSSVTAPGTYATLNFQVKNGASPGTSGLNLTRAILSNDTGANIPGVTASNGTITVNSPLISIVPPSTTGLNHNDTFSVNVTVDPAGNQVKGGEINLKFNQTDVQLNSIVIGNFLGGSPLQFQNQIDNTNGTLKLAYTVQGGGSAVTAPGTYATLNFKIKTNAPAGTSTLNLTMVKLANDTGANIPGVTRNNGTIIVNPPTLCILPNGKNLDLNHDGSIGIGDAVVLINNWGAANGPADLNNDGVVGIGDAVILINHWNQVC